MDSFDYFKQVAEDAKRIQREIEEEENPYHKRHIAEFSEMIDNRINAVVPQMIHEERQKVNVEVETYMNGKKVRSSKDIVNGVRDMICGMFKNNGRSR